MKNKIKAENLIFLMSITFYMILTTSYTNALGNYILEFIGLRPWTGDYSGEHLTIILFWNTIYDMRISSRKVCYRQSFL